MVSASKYHSYQKLLISVFFLITGSILGGWQSCQAQNESPPPSLPVSKWLSMRGPFDPRPYETTLLGVGLFNQEYFDLKNKLWVEKGFSFGGYASGNVQWGSEGKPAHGISESLIIMTWEAVRKPKSAGRLVVGFAHDQTFGRPTTREFADAQRLVETPNDLDTDPELTFTTLGLLHWTHEWHFGPDRGLGMRIGQLYAPSYFGGATYLDDDRRYFMARPLAAAGGAQWVGYNDIGLGINGIVWKNPLYFSVAVMDGKANRKYPDFVSLADGRLLYLAEVGFEHDIDGPNEAAIKITFSHLDVEDGEGPAHQPGQSLMVSGFIHFQDTWALAARYSQSFNRIAADYKQLTSFGWMWLKPFGRSQDLLGLGLFTGKPGDSNYNQESGLEVFYEIQLTHAVSLAPDLQYWFRKDAGTEKVSTLIWGFRTEIDF